MRIVCVPYSGQVFPDGKVYHFETDVCKGRALHIERATWDPAHDVSEKYPFGYVFKDKSIKWEKRIQLNFTHATEGTLRFGIELDAYAPVSVFGKIAMKAVVGALKLIVGNELYHSVGDDPESTVGEAERPVFGMPMWALDRIIETPAGEEPPSLTDPNFLTMGMNRHDKGFRERMENIKFRPGPTYTISFSSISSMLDIALWKISGAFRGATVDMDLFCGRPPLHVVMYALQPPPADSQWDGRHLDSRKHYIFHIAFWSSLRPPPSWRLQQLMPNAKPSKEHGDVTKQSRTCCFCQ
jgi:hypothetical protein